MSEPMIWLLVRGVWETLAMTFVSGFFGFVLGLPVGVRCTSPVRGKLSLMRSSTARFRRW